MFPLTNFNKCVYNDKSEIEMNNTCEKNPKKTLRLSVSCLEQNVLRCYMILFCVHRG